MFKYTYAIDRLQRGWQPGYIRQEVLGRIEESRDRRGLPPIADKNPSMQNRRARQGPPILHIHRKGTRCAFTLQTNEPGIKGRPLQLNLNPADAGDEDSEVELEFAFPPPVTTKVVHRETQYRKQDCPLPTPPPPEEPPKRTKKHTKSAKTRKVK